VTGTKRHPLMPQVPTIAESGVPGYDVTGWFGILAPRKTPQSVLGRLTEQVRKAVVDLRFRDRMTRVGLDVVGSTSEEMLATMRADTDKWAEVIRTTGAKIQ
jgi:tripartite-type tricarboxylate transporter receptor subunit TctC